MITRVVVKEVLRKTCNVCGAAHPDDEPSDRPVEEIHADLVEQGWSVLQPDQGAHSMLVCPNPKHPHNKPDEDEDED